MESAVLKAHKLCARRLGAFLQRTHTGKPLNHSNCLHAVSAAVGVPNWNTLSAIANPPACRLLDVDASAADEVAALIAHLDHKHNITGIDEKALRKALHTVEAVTPERGPGAQPLTLLAQMQRVQETDNANSAKLLSLLEQARGRPHIIDRKTLHDAQAHVRRVHAHVDVDRRQLLFWRLPPASPADVAAAVDRYEREVDKAEDLNRKVSDLIDGISDSTIESVLEKSDLELGMEALLGAGVLAQAASTTSAREERNTRAAEFDRWASAMDTQMLELEREGVRDPAVILPRTIGYMNNLQSIYEKASDAELQVLCLRYPAFARYAEMMENLFEQERQRPTAPTGPIPTMPEELRAKLVALASSGAELELMCRSILDKAVIVPAQPARDACRSWLKDFASIHAPLLAIAKQLPGGEALHEVGIVAMARRIESLAKRLH